MDETDVLESMQRERKEKKTRRGGLREREAKRERE